MSLKIILFLTICTSSLLVQALLGGAVRSMRSSMGAVRKLSGAAGAAGALWGVHNALTGTETGFKPPAAFKDATHSMVEVHDLRSSEAMKKYERKERLATLTKKEAQLRSVLEGYEYYFNRWHQEKVYETRKVARSADPERSRFYKWRLRFSIYAYWYNSEEKSEFPTTKRVPSDGKITPGKGELVQYYEPVIFVDVTGWFNKVGWFNGWFNRDWVGVNADDVAKFENAQHEYRKLTEQLTKLTAEKIKLIDELS